MSKTKFYRIEPRFDEVLNEEQKLASLANGSTTEAEEKSKRVNSLNIFSEILQPAGILFLACGNFNRDNAVPKLKGKEADIVAMGRHYIANPDLVERLRNGWPLNPYDRSTFYGADPPEKGYNDYPFFHETPEAQVKA